MCEAIKNKYMKTINKTRKQEQGICKCLNRAMFGMSRGQFIHEYHVCGSVFFNRTLINLSEKWHKDCEPNEERVLSWTDAWMAILDYDCLWGAFQARDTHLRTFQSSTLSPMSVYITG